MSDQQNKSNSSLISATQSRAKFSGHGDALGAAGKRVLTCDPDNAETLRSHNQSIAINPHEHGFDEILIGVQWDQITAPAPGLMGSLLKINRTIDVDMDIGCLYELQDGTRGAIQAFGEKWGKYDQPPYIQLSGDEREGDEEGFDEILHIKGENWDNIKRVLVYLYIYDGASNWGEINPRVMVDVPGEEDLVVTLSAYDDHLDLCAIGLLENIRGGIKLTNKTEYFPGHEEMDRAFGFGLSWADGVKRS